MHERRTLVSERAKITLVIYLSAKLSSKGLHTLALEKSKGLVTSITILPIKFLVGLANFMALTIPSHRVAIITNSPKAAASAKVPTDAFLSVAWL